MSKCLSSSNTNFPDSQKRKILLQKLSAWVFATFIPTKFNVTSFLHFGKIYTISCGSILYFLSYFDKKYAVGYFLLLWMTRQSYQLVTLANMYIDNNSSPPSEELGFN